MKATTIASVLMTGLAFGLGGCGGGGGGGGVAPPPMTEVPFTSFQAIQPNQTVDMTGLSQSGNGNQTISGSNTTITSANLGAADTGASTMKLGYDASKNLSVIDIATPSASYAFSTSAGDSIDCSSATVCGATKAGSTAEAIVVKAAAMGWNYQTFGIWDETPSPTTWQAGAISAGSPTPVSAVPTVGTATFTGIATGYYFDSVGNPFATGATMSANADFSARSIGFSTSGTQLVNINTSAASSSPGLDLSGTLTYAPGTNQFSGPVNTADTSLSGTATGRFYGPNAEEIGGTYGLSSGTSVSRMLGGFGGKR